ncbi:trypsin-like serine protease [Streptomyces sp. NPDC059575]|uniref:trypsin-like serine protease n=1 Tax=Streptomyces sp. NPDC059575 TaxID=3346872 RepID=UPI0036C8A34C
MSQFRRSTQVSALIGAVGMSLFGSPAQALEGPTADASQNFTARIVVGDSEHSCSGVLVSQRWVLTSGSCFDPTGHPAAGAPAATTTVTVGRTDLNQTSTGAVRTAIELVPAPDRDLVLVKLNAGVAGVKPVALATTPVSADEAVTAAGFGRTKTTWVPDTLHSGAFTATGDSSTDIALTPAGDALICQGDAGGPVLRTNGQTQELVGVASRSWQGGCLGTPAAETRTSAVATRVDDVRAWITGVVTPVPGDMNGDNKPDLVAIDNTGKLFLYPGTGTGALGARLQIGSGGWSGASVTHRGDWNGDGMEDIVAVVGGELRVYPNRGDGTLAAAIKIGTLPTTARIVGIGDTTLDGKPDLLATYDNKLYRYPGTSGTTPSVGAPVLIGSSGWDVMTLTAHGDADRDGRVDLLARDTRDGILYNYLGQPNGTFSDRTEFGHGYTVTNRPLIAGAADADRNGVADMWATAGDGTLKFYKGGSDIHGPIDGPSIQVGSGGWGSITSIS